MHLFIPEPFADSADFNRFQAINFVGYWLNPILPCCNQNNL